MRIKQVELIGFKSFPQRTVLEIPPGVTGIVGPNGCGKSNVVDAIRWVLGEQSAKHLRGDDMESVIFNGNERVAPMGMAEVSLTFDNDGPETAPTDLDIEVSTLPTHLLALPEIMITRRYFRSGDSEYFINKSPCRLKDITELFLGTGVGSKAYAIIEQGRVDRLIHAKPEERRLFIEEAAGTTLYRSRKLAAERKMERTRENLARVNDVLSEIERQMRYLHRQAKKAEAHQRLSVEVRDLDLRIAGRQWHGLQGELIQLREARERQAIGEREARAAVESNEEARRAAATAVVDVEKGLATLRESLAVLEAERDSLTERIRMLRRDVDERQMRTQRLSEESVRIREAKEENRTQIRDAEQERDATAQCLLFDESDLSRRESDLQKARTAVQEVQAKREATKSRLVDHITREVESRNRLTALEHRSEEIDRQVGKLRAEESSHAARLLEIEQQAAARRDSLAQLRERLAAATQEQETRANDVRALAEKRRQMERRTAELDGLLVQIQSRLESLQQIQQNYEGFHRGVRAVMREGQQSAGVLGVVADVIDIPQEYERAVAAALGERLQYVVVEGEQQGACAVDQLRREASGRSSFIPLHPRPCGTNGAVSFNGTSKRLLDLVQFTDTFRGVAESLLGEVILVPDLSSAVSLWQRNGVHVTFVTPEGDVMDPSGVITGGSDRPIEEEILARRREIDGLQLARESAAKDLAQARLELETTGQELERAETTLRSLGAGTHELTVEIVATEKDIERLELERPQCVSRCDVARHECAALLEEASGVAEESATSTVHLAQLEVQRGALEADVDALTGAAAETLATAESLSSDVTAMKVRLAERRERQQAAFAQMESLARRQRELEERELALTEDLGRIEEERREREAAIAAAHDLEGEQATRRTALQDDIARESKEGNAAQENLADLERHGHQLAESLEQAREERSRLEVATSETRLRIDHLSHGIRERYDCDLCELAITVPQEGGADTAEESQRFDDLKARLARIGDVNLTAIDEFRELEERSAFMRTQRDDLDRSLGDLQRTIQKLNRASRTKFAETFAKANETFQKVLPRLFRGGEGHLVLTNEHDLLESGVEIVTRLPGKRLDSMNQLSGGEKALVAVSLIFSLFMINPTPFCILDEVDAPLDDANIGRFSQMIREMSDRSQFILITHNKRTMEASNILYGVTMQEPGISTIISVAMA